MAHNKAYDKAYNKKWEAEHRAERNAYRKKNYDPVAVSVRNRRSYLKNREARCASQAEYERSRWQRMGSGQHADRVKCWTEFFTGLANDTERTIAAFVMVALADFDKPTRRVVGDASFDYNILSEYMEV